MRLLKDKMRWDLWSKSKISTSSLKVTARKNKASFVRKMGVSGRKRKGVDAICLGEFCKSNEKRVFSKTERQSP